MGKSCAEDAYGWQGVKTDKLGNVTDDSFPGHDNYQNGVIPNGSDSTIYCTNWYDGQPGSGYFTDKGTVDSCTHNGVLWGILFLVSMLGIGGCLLVYRKKKK